MIGESVGSYRIISQLGKGGMGVVYLAEHTLLNNKAVVKMLLPELSEQPDVVDRFFNEAKAITLIKHPGIVAIFDFGHHASSGSAFIVMELLEGESLGHRLRRGRMDPVVAAGIARQVASAVGAAHRSGVIHRDLKPDNLFLIPDPDLPERERVKVLDFGIAKLATVTSKLRTRSGDVMGTPLYMSPEQCKNAASVDARTDVYALGCILYEMVCGRPPFSGSTIANLVAAHLLEQPQPPTKHAREIPPALEKTILRALEKSPDDRQATMAAVAVELDAVTGRRFTTPLPFSIEPTLPGPTAQAPVSADAETSPSTTLGRSVGQMLKRGGRHRTLTIGIIAAPVVGVAIIAAVALRGNERATVQPTTMTSVVRADAGHETASAALLPPVTVDAGAIAIAALSPVPTPPPVVRTPLIRASKPSNPPPTDANAVVDVVPILSFLKLGSKPPCDIVVDGNPTGLHTPQSSLEIPPGRHHITLVNPTYAIKETLLVELKPGETQTWIEDYTDRIKNAAPIDQASTLDPFKK